VEVEVEVSVLADEEGGVDEAEVEAVEEGREEVQCHVTTRSMPVQTCWSMSGN